MSRVLLPVFAALTLIGSSLPVFAQDLKDAAARQKIMADQLAQDVTDAISRSYKQEPRDAKFALYDMMNRVTDSTALLPTQRASLRDRLRARLTVVEDAIRSKNVADAQRPTPRDPDRPKYKPSSEPSSGPGSVAKQWVDQGKTAQQINRELIQKREKNIVAVNQGIEKSHVGVGDKEIEFPPYWKQLKAERDKMVNQQLTKKEVALLKTLNSVMSVDYNHELKAVIEHLHDKTGLDIIVDEGSLTDLNVDYKDNVTFKIQKASVRFILKKILGDKGLTYIIKEGAIQVMTPKKASEHTVVRTYQVDDLVSASPQAQMMFGPFVAQAQMMQNAQQLMNLIQMTIEPNYWAPNGPGTMAFYPPTKSLIIRASAEMHYQMNSPGLFGGR